MEITKTKAVLSQLTPVTRSIPVITNPPPVQRGIPPSKEKEKEVLPKKQQTEEWWNEERLKIDKFISTGSTNVQDILEQERILKELEASPIATSKTSNRNKITVLRSKFNTLKRNSGIR
jgi:hypothetical protein